MLKYTRRTLLAATAALTLAACGQADTQTAPDTGPAINDIVLGDVDAPVTLTEYASWTCPACLQFHNDVMPMLKAEYIETGKVKLVFREFPTPPVNISVAGFSLARCAGAETYADSLDRLFAAQTPILNLARTGGDVDQGLRDLATSLGITGEAYDTCLGSTEVRNAIIDALTRGDSQGVNSTPTVFLNGEKLSGYDWRQPAGMRTLIEDALSPTESE